MSNFKVEFIESPDRPEMSRRQIKPRHKKVTAETVDMNMSETME